MLPLFFIVFSLQIFPGHTDPGAVETEASGRCYSQYLEFNHNWGDSALFHI